MWKPQKSGSVLCAGCGSLVGIQDQQCMSCGRWNPGLWGFAPVLRRLGMDLGFVKIVLTGCIGLYVAALLIDPRTFEEGCSRRSPRASEPFFFLGRAAPYPSSSSGGGGPS